MPHPLHASHKAQVAMATNREVAMWGAFLNEDAPPPPRNEALLKARAAAVEAKEQLVAKDQQIELMAAMLKAAEEELRLRSDQLNLTNEMLRTTGEELAKKEKQLTITAQMLRAAEGDIASQAEENVRLKRQLADVHASIRRGGSDSIALTGDAAPAPASPAPSTARADRAAADVAAAPVTESGRRTAGLMNMVNRAAASAWGGGSLGDMAGNRNADDSTSVGDGSRKAGGGRAGGSIVSGGGAGGGGSGSSHILYPPVCVSTAHAAPIRPAPDPAPPAELAERRQGTQVRPPGLVALTGGYDGDERMQPKATVRDARSVQGMQGVLDSIRVRVESTMEGTRLPLMRSSVLLGEEAADA